jgi:hypothetical protein
MGITVRKISMSIFKPILALNLLILITGQTFSQGSLEYSLINKLTSDYRDHTLNEKFLVPSRAKFATYGEYSLACSQDMLDPTKSFNLDSLFSNPQKLEIEGKAKSLKSEVIEKKLVHDPNVFFQKDKVSDSDMNRFYSLSYPIIQVGIGDKKYGLIIESSSWSGGAGGEKLLKIYRLDVDDWVLIHETVIGIT